MSFRRVGQIFLYSLHFLPELINFWMLNMLKKLVGIVQTISLIIFTTLQVLTYMLHRALLLALPKTHVSQSHYSLKGVSANQLAAGQCKQIWENNWDWDKYTHVFGEVRSNAGCDICYTQNGPWFRVRISSLGCSWQCGTTKYKATPSVVCSISTFFLVQYQVRLLQAISIIKGSDAARLIW